MQAVLHLRKLKAEMPQHHHLEDLKKKAIGGGDKQWRTQMKSDV